MPTSVERGTELPPSQENFEDLFDNAPCGYVVTSTDWVITAANATFATMTGYPANDLIGRSLVGLLTPGSQLFHETRHVPVLRLQGRADEIALSIQCADGTTVPTLVNSALVPSDGEPDEIRMVLFDSTGRRDYERDLLAARRAAESSEARVRVLQRASSAFTLADTEERLSAALTDTIRDAFTATHASVLFLDAEANLQLVSGTNPLEELIASGAATPATEALRLGRTVTISTPEEADVFVPGLGDALRGARLEAAMATPLLDKGQTTGVVVSHFGRQRRFDEGSIELFETLARQASHVLARIRLQEQLAELALHDQLTGLANRKLLEERLDQTVAAVIRKQRAVAILFLDLDGFKVVNDQCGHAVGDSVLQQISARLRDVIRAGDTIGRYGGDEFVIICDDTEAASATVIADRIRTVVREPLDGVPDSCPISASIGIALLGPTTNPAISSDNVLQLADAAMYESKNGGKDRVTTVSV
ncbi:diguanylate cyclase [Mycetocola miduiensis]|uniref:Serine/threonine-protein kinase RsbW n=1 Tax=Mycetocola miduiensis TaxID=995034 RepID=A0A1I4YC92_9MICO|nr:diguanylate cyclase [Mycetocola miduiensis]SFN35220.1 serine/threonine-protein kinase RsbW [Mycetocola miduiensis]